MKYTHVWYESVPLSLLISMIKRFSTTKTEVDYGKGKQSPLQISRTV